MTQSKDNLPESRTSNTSNAATGPSPEIRPGVVLAVLMVGTFLAPLDSSIVNIALPSISAQLGESLSAVGWVASAYLLTTAALLLSMGRLGDLWGLRRLYVWGLLIFGAGSFACAMSHTIQMLIAARVFQAVGASMLFAAGPALVTKTFPAQRRGSALGLISLAVSAGLTVGPALGGLLVGAFGWPSIFLINVPLSAIVAAIAWRLLPEETARGERFDVPGAVLGGGSLLALLLSLGEVEHSGPLSMPVVVGVIVAVVLAVAFLRWEKRAPYPMVDLRLFSAPSFSGGVAAATLAYLALFSATFTLPFYLLRVEGISTEAAGLLLTVTPLAMAVIAPIAGRASDKYGSRGLATVGLLVLAIGLIVLSFLLPGSNLAVVGAGLLAAGSGMALFQTPNTASVLKATPRSRAGVGSAFVAEARNVGMAIGVALTAAIVGAHVGPAGLPEGQGVLSPTMAAAFSSGMSVALRVAAAVVLAAAVLAWLFSAEPVERQ